MNRAEAFEYLTLAADQIGADWSKKRVSWIPDEVNQEVERAVDLALEGIDVAEDEWDEVDYQRGRRRSRSRGEVRDLLVEFTREAARTRRNQTTAPVSTGQQRLRLKREQRLAELRAERERVEVEQRERERLAEVERRHIEAEVRAESERVEAERGERWRLRRERVEAEVRARKEREQAEVRAREEREQAERRERWLNRPAPPPEPQPYGVSHEGAEHLVCAWMRHLGVPDAEVTRLVGDGGIDVDSEHYVAQVKNYVGSIPVGEVRALLGSAVSEGKKPLLFTSGSLTAEGAAFATRVGMAVFRYDAMSGTIQGLNELGAVAVERSIPEAFA